jgi:predicted methyltransferase
MTVEVDLRAAINAVSDVVQNRPRPLRNVDQIYMKTGDMVLQSELVSKWAAQKRLAFIGDGDAIGVCVALLQARKILDYGPAEIVVFDFDERICSAVARFADKEKIGNLHSQLYNCLDAFPERERFDCFYTNPPFGASNAGESVKVFVQRGIEAAHFGGEGMVVIADNHELEWPQRVLHNTQRFVLDSGYYVQKMQSQIHTYHLDDNPDLRSCNLIIKALPGNARHWNSEAIRDPSRLAHFYGLNQGARIRYVKEKKRVDYGKAHDDEYEFEHFGSE